MKIEINSEDIDGIADINDKARISIDNDYVILDRETLRRCLAVLDVKFQCDYCDGG